MDGESGTDDDGLTEEDFDALGLDPKIFTLVPEYVTVRSEGMVGDVKHINPDIIHTLTASGFIPIIAPVGIGENGETYNINADVVASKIASALNAERLILLTDVDGVLNKKGELISSIDASTINEMIHSEEIKGGMIPKVECALDALNNKVQKSHIINGKLSHAVILELFTDSGIGTQVFIN